MLKPRGVVSGPCLGMTPVGRAVALALAASVTVAPVVSGSCLPAVPEVPLDAPVFPTGLAVVDDRLLVVSSDFDRAYADGAVLVADLARVRTTLDVTNAPGLRVVEDAWVGSGVVIPPFGERPVPTSGGERVYVPTRGSSTIVALDLGASGALSCGTVGSPPRCTDGARVLQLTATDPFDVIVVNEERDDEGALARVRGAVSLLASSQIAFFSDEPTAGGQALRSDGAIALGDDIAGVRSMVLRPAKAGTDAVLIAGVDLNATLVGRPGAVIAVFRPEAGSTVRRFSISDDMGAISVRDMLVVPAQDDVPDALFVVARGAGLAGPEAVVRYAIIDDSPQPTLKLTAVVSTCAGPTSLALARAPVERLLLTCHDDDTIVALDPLTLATTDVVRFAGRGPYDVVVHPTADPPEAFVSFFSDNSIGVLRLVDAGGAPALVFHGRVGAASPPPEDGRE